MGNPIRALAAAGLLAGPTVLAFFSGGFFEKPRLIAAVSAWALVGVAAVFAPAPFPRSVPARLAILGLALLTAWVGLSYEWAPLGQRAQADVQRLLLYLGLFVAGTALLRGRAARRWTEPALALGTGVVVGYGLSERLLPGVAEFTRSRSAEGRLEQPLTYWNAMGCLSAIGLVLCVRLAADSRQPRLVRTAAAFLGPMLGLGVYLSFSRGALFALAAGLVLLLMLAPSARAQLRAVVTLIGAGALSCLAASFLPTVESLPHATPADSGDGALMLAILVLLSAAAAVATSFAHTDRGEPVRAHLGKLGRPALIAGLVALVLGGLAGVAALEGSPTARSAGSPTSASRFGSADTVRYAFWDVAIGAFARHPLEGTGSGGFAVEWRRQTKHHEAAVDAHSLYIETLSELGLVGAALLAFFLGAVIACGARLHRADAAAAAGPAACWCGRCTPGSTGIGRCPR